MSTTVRAHLVYVSVSQDGRVGMSVDITVVQVRVVQQTADISGFLLTCLFSAGLVLFIPMKTEKIV